VQWQNLVAVTVFELQLLGAVLAFVGLFIGVVVDEKQRTMDDLRQSLRLAAAGEMAGALAHELNQPLTALSVYADACQRMLDLGETGDRLRDTIGRVVAESQRAGDVVRRLRDFFRTGATRLERVGLEELLTAAKAQFERQAQEQGVRLFVEKAPSGTLLADRLQLQLVLRNVVANAFDAVAELAPEKRYVRLWAAPEGQRRIAIFVEDGGPGPSQEFAASLFEPFQSTKSSGLGLGLAISRAIVEVHGGTLGIEPSARCVFKIVLPTEGGSDDAR
jgi:two-component system sensor kinase FixL